MVHRAAVMLAVIAAALPAAADYGTAPELLDAMLLAQQERAEGVSNYVMDVTLMNQPSSQFYERTQATAPGGRSIETFRPVPLVEVRSRLGEGSGTPSAQERAALGGFLTSVGDAAGGGLSPDLAEAFRSSGAGTGPGAGPWGADGLERMESFAQRARIAGRETIEGRSAYVVKADGLNITEISDGQTFEIRSMTLWVDADDLLMLKMLMEGRAEQNGQSREMFIERIDRDYRFVPGSRMILPYRTILRMGGMLSPEQQREMEEARVQLAELDRQMATMPAQQKQMMQSMMGPQIETMRKMVEGGAFEIETTVREIRVNQEPSDVLARVPAAAPGPAAMPAAGALATRAATPAPAVQNAETLQRDREACLQRKVAAAQASKKKKKRFGKLMRSVGRIVGRHATGDLASDVGRVSRDVYDANATAQDLKSAAEALGISQDDIAACESPESAR